MAYNTTAFLDKLACNDIVDFGNCLDRFERTSWSKSSFDYLEVKLKVFKKDENKEFRLAQNLKTGETDLIQLKRLRDQMFVAVIDFSKEENVPLCK